MVRNGSDLRGQFLAGMSQAAATVNVVTTDGPGGRAGVTVSAMSSVSADTDRPTLLTCVHHLAPAAAAILKNEVFCVNVLRDDQSYISDTFAGRFSDQVADKFDCAAWTTQTTGAPRVVDPLVAFDCRMVAEHRVGTHHVFFGQVEDIFMAPSGSPLIYAKRAYGATMRIDPAGSIGAGAAAEGKRLSVGCFRTFGPFLLPRLIAALKAQGRQLELSLVEGDHRRVQESLLAGETEIGLLYDLDLPEELQRETLTELPPYVLFAEDHALAAEEELAPQDLADHPMVLLNAPPSRDYFLTILAQAGVEPQVAFESGNFEMVRGMVGHGLGYTLLATRPAADVTYDGKPLVARPLTIGTGPSRVVLAYRRGARLSKPAEEFAWLCREVFGADLD
ncbi:MAG: LysR substrate-binding domain-containing protein [Paracoccaceae bacterium]|nr:LysR substrate-binding domain-containing protein [Paracoccaceae bacterium]